MQVLVLRLQTANSIEEHIYSVARQKRDIADRSITGGFFDGKTNAQERRAYLLDLLSKTTSESHRYSTVSIEHANLARVWRVCHPCFVPSSVGAV